MVMQKNQPGTLVRCGSAVRDQQIRPEDSVPAVFLSIAIVFRLVITSGNDTVFYQKTFISIPLLTVHDRHVMCIRQSPGHNTGSRQYKKEERHKNYSDAGFHIDSLLVYPIKFSIKRSHKQKSSLNSIKSKKYIFESTIIMNTWNTDTANP